MKSKSEERDEGCAVETGGCANPSDVSGGFSRRSFLQGMGLAAGAATLPAGWSHAQGAEATGALGPGPIKLALKINGEAKSLEIEPRATLLEVLREKLDLTGAKLVCDRGSCGGCTVLVGEESICSCMTLAVDCREKEITTVEGLAQGDKLHPVQEAFIEHDGQQCGFCTPGLVMRSVAFLKENPKPTLDQIKTGLSGNICRCGTYTHIFAALMSASKEA